MLLTDFSWIWTCNFVCKWSWFSWMLCYSYYKAFELCIFRCQLNHCVFSWTTWLTLLLECKYRFHGYSWSTFLTIIQYPCSYVKVDPVMFLDLMRTNILFWQRLKLKSFCSSLFEYLLIVSTDLDTNPLLENLEFSVCVLSLYIKAVLILKVMLRQIFILPILSFTFMLFTERNNRNLVFSKVKLVIDSTRTYSTSSYRTLSRPEKVGFNLIHKNWDSTRSSKLYFCIYVIGVDDFW